LDIGLICGERRRVIGIDDGDHRLHSDRRKMKAKLPAPKQNFLLARLSKKRRLQSADFRQ
jgi:hypothetical protein